MKKNNDIQEWLRLYDKMCIRDRPESQQPCEKGVLQLRERTLYLTGRRGGMCPVSYTHLDVYKRQVYLQTQGNKPLIFGGGSPDGSPSEDLSGVEFVNGTRPGNQKTNCRTSRQSRY